MVTALLCLVVYKGAFAARDRQLFDRQIRHLEVAVAICSNLWVFGFGAVDVVHWFATTQYTSLQRNVRLLCDHSRLESSSSLSGGEMSRTSTEDRLPRAVCGACIQLHMMLGASPGEF